MHRAAICSGDFLTLAKSEVFAFCFEIEADSPRLPFFDCFVELPDSRPGHQRGCSFEFIPEILFERLFPDFERAGDALVGEPGSGQRVDCAALLIGRHERWPSALALYLLGHDGTRKKAATEVSRPRRRQFTGKKPSYGYRRGQSPVSDPGAVSGELVCVAFRWISRRIRGAAAFQLIAWCKRW